MSFIPDHSYIFFVKIGVSMHFTFVVTKFPMINEDRVAELTLCWSMNTSHVVVQQISGLENLVALDAGPDVHGRVGVLLVIFQKLFRPVL